MLASLSNSATMRGRVVLAVFTASIGLAGCNQPEIDRPGTWKPTGVNDQNLRAMLANPQDTTFGTGAITARGDNGARAVTRLLTEHRRQLLNASVSRVGSSDSSADSSSGAPAAAGASSVAVQ